MQTGVERGAFAAYISRPSISENKHDPYRPATRLSVPAPVVWQAVVLHSGGDSGGAHYRGGDLFFHSRC